MRSRTRLTITLPPDLLAQIEQLIDGHTIRNRSHAIEQLIRQSLTPTVSKAVLLAGGRRGNGQVPALATIQGQALISLTINNLSSYGIRTFIILAGQNEPAIRDCLRGGESYGVTIHYVPEEQPLGTAGALKLAESYLTDGPFLVLHADVLTNINVSDFIRFHLDEKTLATMAVKPRQTEPNYGKVMLQGNHITNFFEASQDQGISIINTGVYLFEPGVLGLIENGRTSNLESDVFPKLAGLGELCAFLFQGIWFDISTPENYQAAQTRWQRKGGIKHVTRN
jgi:NDP-sugar pyrophosphorylase family protein